MKPKPWKFVKGYNHKYGINIYGNVWSYPSPESLTAKGKQLKHSIHKNGYHYVTLFKDGKGKRYYIHRLVAESFMANPNKFKCVRHIDGNKDNNCVVNLEYANNSLIQRKLDPKVLPPVLCKSFVKILKRNHAKEIRAMFSEGNTVAQIMRAFNASRYQVEVCLYGTAVERRELRQELQIQKTFGKEEYPDFIFGELLEYHKRVTNHRKERMYERWIGENVRKQSVNDYWKAQLKRRDQKLFSWITEEYRTNL